MKLWPSGLCGRSRSYAGASFPPMFRGGAFVGEHGSRNGAELNGYKALFIRFAGGRPVGIGNLAWRVSYAGGASGTQQRP